MNRSAERILVLLNPASGFISKDITTSLILRKLRRHFASVSLVYTNSPAHANEITRQGLNHLIFLPPLAAMVPLIQWPLL
jgi:hypothetical protein